MQIILYRYNGKRKNLYKLDNIAYSITINDVYLKEGSSVINPTIIVKATGSVEMHNYNYCYISSFNRYYFAEVDSITNELWTFRLKCDVLMSYWINILNNQAFIERSQAQFNNMIEDDCANFESSNDILIQNLSNATQGDKKNIELNNNILWNDYNVVITCVNDLETQGFTQGHPAPVFFGITPPISNMDYICVPFDNGESYYTYFYCTSWENINTSLKKIYQDTAVSFIKSVNIYPFEIDVLRQYDSETEDYTGEAYKYNLRLGSSDYGTNNVAKLKDKAFYYKTFFDYTFPNYTFFYQYEPYTTFELFIPYVGWKQINIKDVNNSRILISFRINFETGKGTIYLINYTKNYVIASYEAQIGINIPLSRSNLEELNMQRINNAISMALGIVGGAVSTGIGIATANPIAITGGALGLSSTIAKGVTGQIGLFEKGQVQVRDGNSGLDNRQVLLKITRKVNVSIPSDEMGRPVRRVLQLNACDGFTKCGTVNKFECPSSEEEYKEIERLLKDGIIINHHLS